MDLQTQEPATKKRAAPPALDLQQPRRRRSSGLATPLTSTRTPTSRKKWPSTPAKIQGPASDKAIHERALAELTAEEDDRKALNAIAVEKNSKIEATGFSGGAERAALVKRVEDRAKLAAELDEMYKTSYDEFREPVDIEQGGLCGGLTKGGERQKESRLDGR